MLTTCSFTYTHRSLVHSLNGMADETTFETGPSSDKIQQRNEELEAKVAEQTSTINSLQSIAAGMTSNQLMDKNRGLEDQAMAQKKTNLQQAADLQTKENANERLKRDIAQLRQDNKRFEDGVKNAESLKRKVEHLESVIAQQTEIIKQKRRNSASSKNTSSRHSQVFDASLSAQSSYVSTHDAPHNDDESFAKEWTLVQENGGGWTLGPTDTFVI